MQKVDLIIKNAKELVTCAGGTSKPKTGEDLKNLYIINDGWVAIKEDKIVAVGTEKEIKSKVEITEDTQIIDAAGKTVLPGLVDSHTHLAFGGSRENELELKLEGAAYLDILAAGGGILSTVRATREATKEELKATSTKYLNQMLSQGTTTAEAKSGYGLKTEYEIKQLEVIKELNEEHPVDLVPTFLGAHAIPTEFKGGKEDRFIDIVVEEMMPAVKEKGLAEFCDVFCENGVFTVEQSRRVLEKAKELGFKLKIHSDEIYALGGTEMASELNATSADHLLVVTDEGIEKMSEAGVVGVLLPGTTFNLREDHYAPARRMIDKGVAIALATDFNPGSCPTNSMDIIMTIGCLYLRLIPAEVINAITINAAHAIDRAQSVGSIEEGKQADLVIFDAPNHQYLCYRFGSNLVEKVVKKGKIVIGGA
ncbi:MAG: imidazolonepropionase [Desulfitibacter sp. BRH_c19]|nr:MAG: imidazolonepropionase [Desulfitibacter sp. BRH_c19]